MNLLSLSVPAAPETFIGMFGKGRFAPDLSGLRAATMGAVFSAAKSFVPAVPGTDSVESAVGDLGEPPALASAAARTNLGSASSVAAIPPGSVTFDFDGDGRADIGRWHAANNEFKVKNSYDGSFSTHTIGSATAKIVPGDFDGDSKTDAAVFSSGTWTIRKSSNGATQTITLGAAGDVPAAGDHDGDGKTDAAVYRPSTSTWIVLQSSNSATVSTAWGGSGDVAVPGNYDGDGRADIAVFRPSTGEWHILGSTSGYFSAVWGIASDTPAPADYDDDGKTDITVFRRSTGTWYVRKSSSPTENITQTWGNYADQPVPADYDGDGKADFAVWRPTTGVWHTLRSVDQQYESQALGVPGDVAVPSAYLKQIGGEVAPYALAQARLSPKNATGGTDLYSRNFSWGTSLVSLPGRAGMGAGFGVSYNSLVWTKEGSSIHFDTDAGNISPGFRFGYPTIEPSYYDEKTTRFAFLLVTPDGGRIEFRQTAASEIYESADGSYVQLRTKHPTTPNDPVEDVDITVTGTDGTQMDYHWKGGAYRCKQIKDRNGNYITISHDDFGLLRTVTDTLGRVVTVNYDTSLYPTSITQTWKTSNGLGSNVTHTWASFSYGTTTIDTDFHTSLAVNGPPDGTMLKVLERVTYADGSSARFTYNGYGQVWKVENYAADDHKLNHVWTNIQSPMSSQTENGTNCPRFTETRSWIEDFNNNQEITVPNDVIENQTYTLPNGSPQTGTLVQITAPNGVVSKTYVASSGWRESLPVVTEDWFAGQKKRWSWTNWTQDDENLTYINNARVIESKVGDEASVKRTTVDYMLEFGTGVATYGLVSDVKVYKADQTSVLKHLSTSYNLNEVYASRRIIGLPDQVTLRDENGALMSKLTYSYDEGNFSETEQNITPIQHDNLVFGANFMIGRGNQTSVTRWDVNFPDNAQNAVTTQTQYNTAGGAVAKVDPVGREVTISYVDSFNDGLNRNAYAYPKRLTDPAGNFSEVTYRYDIGANVWAKSPDLNATTPGKITTRNYDGVGRLEKQRIENNGAYTRYEYPANQTSSKVFSTIKDANNDGSVNVSDEVLSESFFDGAGRMRKSRSPLLLDTAGNTVTWVGQQAEYDSMGRVKRQAVPTEVDSAWNAVNDDLTRGWQWTSREFDWKGRVTREIGLGDADRINSYEGCGCAGGEIITIKGELLAEGRRTRKIYSDILGRDYKTEVLDWDGNVYTASVTAFNGRDQAVSVKQFEGAEGSSVFQEADMTYDGHGRLRTRHTPEQGEDEVTTYTYTPDDRPHSVTDGRGANSTFTFNDRGLVSRIDHSLPGAAENFPTINPNSNAEYVTPCGPDDPDYLDCEPDPDPTPNPQPYLSNVQFTYDAMGNRTQMIDTETGSTNCEYDSLSRMTAEHKLMRADWAIPDHDYSIQYGYDLTGRLASVTDPFGQRIDYKVDKAGRLEQITGTPFGSGTNTVTDYIDNIDYRAWGAKKQIEYGNDAKMTQTFDERLRVADFQVLKTGQTAPYIRTTYEYYNDNRLKFSDDSSTGNVMKVPEQFDRSYKYDFAGRLTQARTGIEARGGTATDRNEVPYKHDYAYNAFGNVTSRQTFTWTEADNKTHSWEDNRESTWTYDADGRLKTTPENRYYYDAAGAVVMSTRPQGRREIRHLDGDGRAVRNSRYTYSSGQYNLTKSEYFIHSSVLGKVLTEVKSNGTKQKTNVYGPNGIVATQNYQAGAGGVTTQVVHWEHMDAAGTSYVETGSTGYMGSPAELDPLGSDVKTSNPYAEQPLISGPGTRWGDPFGGYSCRLDGFEASCSQVAYMLAIGGAEPVWNHEQPIFLGHWAEERDWSTEQLYEYFVPAFNLLGDTFTQTPLTTEQIGMLQDGLTNFTKDKDCNKFITKILEKLKSTGLAGYDTTDVNKLFELIFGNPSNVFLSVNFLEVWEKGGVKSVPNAQTGFGNSTSGKTTTIRFDSYRMGFAHGNVGGRAFQYSQADAMVTLIHELIHAFGGSEYFSHLQQAFAASATAAEMGIVGVARPNQKDFATYDAFDKASSSYFSDLLKAMCGGTN